jgi:hypothetical protein
MKTLTVKTATLPSGLTLPYAETGDPGGTPVVFIQPTSSPGGTSRSS